MSESARLAICLCCGGVVFLCFLPSLINTSRMKKRFKRLIIGMAYDEVVNIMGSPDKTHEVGDAVVCTWRIRVVNAVTVRTAYFKSGVLHSVSKDDT